MGGQTELTYPMVAFRTLANTLKNIRKILVLRAVGFYVTTANDATSALFFEFAFFACFWKTELREDSVRRKEPHIGYGAKHQFACNAVVSVKSFI